MRVSHKEICPHCRARDGVSTPLTFSPFGAIIPEAGGGGFKVGQPARDEGDAPEGPAKT
jgi:hypothetical protein